VEIICKYWLERMGRTPQRPRNHTSTYHSRHPSAK
jgi:hypothetical protein